MSESSLDFVNEQLAVMDVSVRKAMSGLFLESVQSPNVITKDDLRSHFLASLNGPAPLLEQKHLSSKYMRRKRMQYATDSLTPIFVPFPGREASFGKFRVEELVERFLSCQTIQDAYRSFKTFKEENEQLNNLQAFLQTSQTVLLCSAFEGM